MPQRQLDLDTLVLDSGSHSPDHTFCVMEAVAYISGERWSDHPECASPVISSFLRSWNDSLPDDDRQRLKPYILRVIGTATGTEDEKRRAWLATDWLVRTFTPAWLKLAGLHDRARECRELPELTSRVLATAAMPIIRAARQDADAAADAAWAAAADAAWAAAADAAWAAAWDAAGAAARAALQPTVVALQASAFDLLDRMIAVGKTA